MTSVPGYTDRQSTSKLPIYCCWNANYNMMANWKVTCFWTQNSKRRMCTLISAVLSDIYCWTIFRMENVMINVNSNENCKSLPSLKSNYKRMISSVLSEISFQTTSKWNICTHHRLCRNCINNLHLVFFNTNWKMLKNYLYIISKWRNFIKCWINTKKTNLNTNPNE